MKKYKIILKDLKPALIFADTFRVENNTLRFIIFNEGENQVASYLNPNFGNSSERNKIVECYSLYNVMAWGEITKD